MNEKIIGQTFDQERSLYNLKDTQAVDCIFGGTSRRGICIKRPRDVALKNCLFFSALSFVAFQKVFDGRFFHG